MGEHGSEGGGDDSGEPYNYFESEYFLKTRQLKKSNTRNLGWVPQRSSSFHAVDAEDVSAFGESDRFLETAMTVAVIRFFLPSSEPHRLAAWSLGRQFAAVAAESTHGAGLVKEVDDDMLIISMDDSEEALMATVACFNAVNAHNASISSHGMSYVRISISLVFGRAHLVPGDVCGNVINQGYILSEASKSGDLLVTPAALRGIQSDDMSKLRVVNRVGVIRGKRFRYFRVVEAAFDNESATVAAFARLSDPKIRDPGKDSFKDLCTMVVHESVNTEAAQALLSKKFRSNQFILYTAMGDAHRIRRESIRHMFHLIMLQQANVTRVLDESPGFILRVSGTQILTVFSRPTDLIKTVMILLEEVASFNAERQEMDHMSIKFGVHYSDTVINVRGEENDIYGKGFKIASVLGRDVARNGDILLSNEALQGTQRRSLLKKLDLPRVEDEFLREWVLGGEKGAGLGFGQKLCESYAVEEGVILVASQYFNSDRLLANLSASAQIRRVLERTCKMVGGRRAFFDGPKSVMLFDSIDKAMLATYVARAILKDTNEGREQQDTLDVAFAASQGKTYELPQSGRLISEALDRAEMMVETTTEVDFSIGNEHLSEIPRDIASEFQAMRQLLKRGSTEYSVLRMKGDIVFKQRKRFPDLDEAHKCIAPPADVFLMTCTFQDALLLRRSPMTSSQTEMDLRIEARFRNEKVIVLYSEGHARHHNISDVEQLQFSVRKESLETPVMEAYDGVVLHAGPAKCFVLFNNVDDAVEAALSTRRVINDNNILHSESSTDIIQRFSIHQGDLLVDIESRELFGSSADFCVWLASQATYSGEIVCSMQSFAGISSRLKGQTEINKRIGYLNGADISYHCIH